jgi:methylmalonyl-CoA mutase N-terminal domain/subunit
VPTGERKERFETLSGLPIPEAATPRHLEGWRYEEALGDPGAFPYTRGIRRNMYRGRLWTMRQYAGFGSAEETNRRFRFLLAEGQTGLSTAFDLPTQMGYDSDHPMAEGEVGRAGVAISSLADMERLFAGIPLGEVSTSMTINAPAAILLAMYVAVAKKAGVPEEKISGTVQNDILKEYVARGTYIFPPEPSLRLVADTFRFCSERLPRFNPISISGYHIREAGSTAAQEVAFTLANALAYVRSAVAAGLAIDSFAPRLSFFFNAHMDLFEEVAKFRAARRLWARLMRAEGAQDPRSMMLRFHAQTAGSALTAQQPEVNLMRVTVQALAAVLGGCQSLHTNGFDEALAIPTARSALLALRTQQVLAYESGVAETVDPLGGSYYVEWLTDRIEEEARHLLDAIEAMGGAVAAIRAGTMQRAIEEAAYRYQRQVESGERVVVGVNRFVVAEEEPLEIHRLDPAVVEDQLRRLRQVRAERDPGQVAAALRRLEEAARGDDPLLPPICEAVVAYATLGEITDTLRKVFGVYRGGSGRGA